ncbi:MAG: dihydroorotate dehydrogenase [Planctomycetota bacterium]|jgi:dihydroorotate dehydrogenase (NAD+) catalytic subunit
MAQLTVQLGSLTLKNPILAASGTFGFGFELSELLDLSALGGIVLKSLTVSPRAGNPPPRLAETPAGVLNSIGLENPGLERFLDEILPAVRPLPTAVVASIAGERVSDFERLAEALGAAEGIDALEVNVSCPNQEGGGMAFGVDPKMTATVVQAVRAKCAKPVFVKLTPNVTQVAPIARSAEQAGADAVALVNTFQGLVIDWRERRPAIRGLRGRGGVSGPAIKPLALRHVRDAFEAVSIPVIGMGGIVSAEDAMEFIVAGATAVQIGSAHFRDPEASVKMAGALSTLLEAAEEPDIRQWIGTLQDNPQY